MDTLGTFTPDTAAPQSNGAGGGGPMSGAGRASRPGSRDPYRQLASQIHLIARKQADR